MATITSSMNVGEIVNYLPQAADVFKKYRIDFCCGGNRPLKDVLHEKELNELEIIQLLEKVQKDIKERGLNSTNWEETPYEELISHIVHTHHAFLNNELPQLSQYVTKVFRVHGPDHSYLAKVHKLFHELKTELEQHTIKEEAEEFPLILEYEKDKSPEKLEQLKGSIAALESEHEGAGDILKEIRNITNDYELPPGACRTFTLTYQRLEALENDLFQHIHLENNILFPRVLKEIL